MGNRTSIQLFQQSGRLIALMVVVFLVSCSPSLASSNSVHTPTASNSTPTILSVDPAAAIVTSTITATTKVTATATATVIEPTAAPSTTPTNLPTLAPPPGFNTDTLYDNVLPVTYLEDTCMVYSQRWNVANAAPGTVVVPVMFHGVTKRPPSAGDNISVSADYFKASMKKARDLGFETITIQQLVDFLHHNAYIPPRSLLLIIDDRRLGTVKEHFLPILEEYDWHLTMAYITGVINEQEWSQLKEVLETGRVEVQAHGFMHNGETYITKWTSEEIIRQELFSPLQAFDEHAVQEPLAFIWPGGNFNQISVDLAQEAGYQVGFTVFARGPIMHNWIPLGEPEREMNNPLIVLPRYWSTTLYRNLDYAVEIGKSAQAQAEAQKFQEIEWFQANCTGYPPMSFPLTPDETEVHDRW